MNFWGAIWTIAVISVVSDEIIRVIKADTK